MGHDLQVEFIFYMFLETNVVDGDIVAVIQIIYIP